MVHPGNNNVGNTCINPEVLPHAHYRQLLRPELNAFITHLVCA